jgi:putative long chain acyl-CoA synthase
VTRSGTVLPRVVERALGELDAVDLAAVYPVVDSSTDHVRTAAAVTLRPGAVLKPAMLDHALTGLEPEARPDVIHVLDTLPMTSWHRPSTTTLRAAGLPAAGDNHGCWRKVGRRGRYRA